jgi:hypothetical protein
LRGWKTRRREGDLAEQALRAVDKQKRRRLSKTSCEGLDESRREGYGVEQALRDWITKKKRRRWSRTSFKREEEEGAEQAFR